MKVLMVPHLSKVAHNLTYGIARVVAEYFRYLPDYGIDLVHQDASDYDIKVVHAGWESDRGGHAQVAMTHGLNWTADHDAPRSEYSGNARVIESIRHARQVTVPSRWVAETFQRDMKFSPHVVPHGIRVEEWDHNHRHENYILWNKNRKDVVCDPVAVTELALLFPKTRFVTTFADRNAPGNVTTTGVMQHHDMMNMVQRAMVYLSTTKETFGIGVLEAMAAGVPVLGWAQGGNLDLVQHGRTGYLAEAGNYEDLAQGLSYCMEHRDALGAYARERAREFTWERVAEQVAGIYRLAGEVEPPTVGIVVPSYMYGDKVERAINSAIIQTYGGISSIIVVDDGSNDEGKTQRIVEEISARDSRVRYVRQDNSGVAEARNLGIKESKTKYICCLDADDAIEPTFIERLVPVLEADNSIGIAYTGLRIITANGRSLVGRWPGEFNYEKQMEGHNQVPTCCLFRREMWERLGGYRQRYAPMGCGSEDAEFWLRAGAIGYGAIRATPEPLFIYSMGTGGTSRPDYEEVNWLEWSPWIRDGGHPFASVAKPAEISHPVRAYDEPIVSIIVPVGPGHTHTVIDTIDSVEAQTFRKWELIVVDDTGLSTDCDNCDSSWLDDLIRTYPYIRVFKTPGKAGPGYARNRGVEMSRAPLILYLDADDFLKSFAVEEMLVAYAELGTAIYTDYEAHTTGYDMTKASRTSKNNIKYHDPSDGYTVISRQALNYDWMRIQKGIENPPYIWNLITTLFPKAWHDEIGGFDEGMPSWEDYDYWVRMAYAGKPFTRLPMELVVYLYHTGSRREEGHQIGGQLIEYLKYKRQGVEMMACTGCGKSPTTTVFRRPAQQVTRPSVQAADMALDSDFVLIEFRSPNLSQTHIYGTAQFEYRLKIPNGMRIDMIKHSRGGYRFYYGYHGGGERFIVHKEDAALERYFEPVEMVVSGREIEIPVSTEKRELPPPPPMPKRMTVEDMVGEEIEEQVVAPSLPPPPPPPPGPQLVEEKVEGVTQEEVAQEEVAQEDTVQEDDMLTKLKAGLSKITSSQSLSTLLRQEAQDQSRPWVIAAIRERMAELDISSNLPYSSGIDLQSLPGVGADIAAALEADGIETADDILALGVDGLKKYKGVGQTKAEKIIGVIQSMK